MIKLSSIVPFYKGIRKLTRLISHKELTGKIYIKQKKKIVEVYIRRQKTVSTLNKIFNLIPIQPSRLAVAYYISKINLLILILPQVIVEFITIPFS